MAQTESFDDYWLRFVRDHSRAGTRWTHAAGNVCTLGLLAVAPFVSSWLFLAAPIPALVASRLSHLFIERNQPLSAAENPAFFLRSEFKMLGHLVTGSMEREVGRAFPTA